MMESCKRFFLDWEETTGKLTAAQKGRLMDAVAAYARGDTGWKSAVRGLERWFVRLMAERTA